MQLHEQKAAWSTILLSTCKKIKKNYNDFERKQLVSTRRHLCDLQWESEMITKGNY